MDLAFTHDKAACLWFNNLFGLTKNCAVYGIDIDKQVKFKRFGKYFCSEDDAEQYSKRNISGEISQGANPVKIVGLEWAVHDANKS